MKNFKIDSKKKKINYRLEFKYNNELVNQVINLKELEKEDLIINGENFDYIIELVILKSGMLGVKVNTIDLFKIVTFSLPQLDIQIIEEETEEESEESEEN